MSAPSPCYVTQTPQREFAGAKVQKKYGLGKFWGEKVRRNWILQEKLEKLAVRGCEFLIFGV